MSRTIVDELLKYTININGDPARKELYDLERAQRKLKSETVDLVNEKKKLEKSNKKESTRYKELTAQIKSNEAAMAKNQGRMTQLKKSIGLTALTMSELRSEARRLRLMLNNAVPGSVMWKKYREELSKVNSRLYELRVGSASTKLSLKKLSAGVKKSFGIIAWATATLAGLSLGFRKIIDFSGEFSDAQKGVEKTTGLSAEAVDELTIKLNKINTRSSRVELLALAEEAGRLGKDSVDDIAEFVATADQIKVALGDDFQGDINDNIRLIGKLTEQYAVGGDVGATFGEGMTMLGSAINEVSASGSAQAGFLVDYMSRMVGVSRVTKMTTDQQLGFAAVLDESGQSVEVSGTALSKLIMDMAENLKDYGAIAKMGETEFRKLFNEDTNEALLAFLQGLNGNNEGLEQMVTKLSDLGVDGARARGVLAALASQTDKVREKQDLANDSLYRATSLNDEFKRQNESLGAILDQIKKRFNGLWSGEKFQKGLKSGFLWIAKFIGAMEDTDGSVTKVRENLITFGKILLIATAGLISYKASAFLATLWTNNFAKAQAFSSLQTKIAVYWNNLGRNSSLLFAAAKAVLTGNLNRATAAMRVFNTATKANPIGLIITILGAAAMAWTLYADKIDDATKAQKVIGDVNAQAEKSIAGQVSHLQTLIAVAKNTNISLDQRKKAIEELNRISPKYLGNLSLENIEYQNSKKAIDNYVESLKNKALEQALVQKRTDLLTKLIEAENSSIEDQATWYDKLGAGVAKVTWGIDYEGNVRLKALERKAETIDSIKSEIKALDDYQSKLIETGKVEVNSQTSSISSTNLIPPTDEKAEKQLKDLQEKIRKTREDLIIDQLQRDQKEIAQVNKKYDELVKLAEGHEKELKEIQKLRKDELDALDIQQEKRKEEEKLAIRKEFGLVKNDELKKLELEKLVAYRELELISVEDFERAKADIEKRYRDQNQKEEEENHRKRLEARVEYIQMYQSSINAIGNAAVAFRDAEMLRVEEVTQFKNESEEDFTKRKDAEEAKRKEIAKKYAGVELLVKTSNIIGSTAVAIMKALELGPIAGPIAAVAMGVEGAAQLTRAKAEYDKIQGYESGLYPVQDHLGRKFNASYLKDAGTGMLNSPTILAGEKPEFIIDPRTTGYLQANAPDIIEGIYMAAKRVRGYESGKMPTNNNLSGPNNEVMILKPVIEALTRATNRLSTKLNDPLYALVGESQVPNLTEIQKKNEEIITRSRLIPNK